MTSSSKTRGWNDDQLDDLLTKFYEQETPAQLRNASQPTDRSRRTEPARIPRPKRRFWQSAGRVAATILFFGVSILGGIWWISPSEPSGENVPRPIATESESRFPQTPIPSKIDPHATPVETTHRVKPARLTTPDMQPASEMPEWDIQVFPIDNDKMNSRGASPAIAEPSARRLTD